jgi:hypothetical protein
MPTLPLTPDELLTTTRSVRKRLDLTRDVPIDLVRECLEVALQAPSGSNRQGWHWMVITDETAGGVGSFYRQAVASYRSHRVWRSSVRRRSRAQRGLHQVGDSVAISASMGECRSGHSLRPCASAERGQADSGRTGGMDYAQLSAVGYRLTTLHLPRNRNLELLDSDRHPARRPHPDHLPATPSSRRASAAGRAPHQLLVATPTCR